jgi:uncharacterized membrane protein required for colicin V production
MKIFDIIGIVFIVMSIAVFWKRGILKIIFPIIVVVLGIWLSFNFSDIILGILGKTGKNIMVNYNWLGYIIAFVGYFLILNIIGYILRNFFRDTPLKWIDNLLGSIFGIIFATLIIMIVLYVMIKIDGKPNKIAGESVLFLNIFKTFVN